MKILRPSLVRKFGNFPQNQIMLWKYLRNLGGKSFGNFIRCFLFWIFLFRRKNMVFLRYKTSRPYWFRRFPERLQHFFVFQSFFDEKMVWFEIENMFFDNCLRQCFFLSFLWFLFKNKFFRIWISKKKLKKKKFFDQTSKFLPIRFILEKSL